MLRFTIRDVLWLTVVVAMALMWWAARREVIATRFALQEERSRNDVIAELNKTTNLDVVQMPLKDTLMYISELHAVPVVLSSRVNGNMAVTDKFRGIPLRAGLEKLLSPHDLDFRVQEGAIVVEPKKSGSKR